MNAGDGLRAGVLALGLSAATTLAGPVAASAAPPAALYVAPNGSNHGTCSRQTPCATITHAVAVAHAGDSVLVAPSTYRGQVTVSKRLTLRAEGPGVEIDATGATNGIALGVVFSTPTQPRPIGDASGSVVSGFMVKNANQEGILALGSHLTLAGNIVANNDLGATAAGASGECASEGSVPGDCGEAIHLAGVTKSVIAGNYVTGNTGGILVSDEFGPTAFNRIINNAVVNNASDCGITVPGHNPNALSSTGARQPNKGGVYRNRISGNVVNGNGAAGIGFFAGGPGTASYDNVAEHNRVSSNGLPGVAMHTHTPNADVNGNQVINNFFARNGLGAPAFHQPPGDPGTPVNKTTDLDIVSDPGATPITGSVIRGNLFTDAQVGIWLVTTGRTKIAGNTFHNVDVHVRRS